MQAANIILVGFMGTGKTATGTILARQAGLSFVDFDALIEDKAGKAISTIFADEGEAAFRAMEHDLARAYDHPAGAVIATGGGIVLNPANVPLLAKGGLVVCLQASVEQIVRRLEHDTSRPLLQTPDKRERIATILASRAALYAQIPTQIDTDGRTAEDVAHEILGLYRTMRLA